MFDLPFAYQHVGSLTKSMRLKEVVKMWVSSGTVGVDPVKMSSNLAAVCLVGGSMEGRATHRLQHWHHGIIIANM